MQRIKPVTRAILVILLGLIALTRAARSEDLIPAPAATFSDLNGVSIGLSAFVGKVVLVNFWGTWCRPCLQEIPELVRLSAKYQKRGLEVVGVAVDSGKPADIRAFIVEHDMHYRIVLGDLSLVKRQFRVAGFPTSILIDRAGLLRKRYIGPQNYEVLKKDVEPLL